MNHRQIRELRRLLGLTQYGLARPAKVGRTRLSLFECGHIPLRADELARIQHALLEEASGRVLKIDVAVGSAGFLDAQERGLKLAPPGEE